jgi:eukaryotic-like serine/threonine-protein kinase
MTPQRTIAHYRITAKLGEGGMGEVYRATDTKLNRDVAIKILPEAFAQDHDRMARFTREAQVLASLNHPNIAAIYGVEERALVMELVDGPMLSERIARGPIPLEEATPIIEQLIDALEYAHEKGVVHRDLKPANIKITPEGRVKVLDFGLAKALAGETAVADPASSPTLTMRATMAGVIMGTAGYMSPEQARGQSVDKRADIWAFGVVVYEILTGRPLFGGPTVSDTLAAVLKEEPAWELVPDPMRHLVRTCLVKDARRRMRDIGDARLLMNETPAAQQVQAARRRVLPWVAVTVLIAVIAAALTALHFRDTPQEAAPIRFQIQAPDKTSFEGFALSPDGRQLAFVALETTGRRSVWLRPLASLIAHELPGTEGAVFPFWSPDSRFIGFSVPGKLKKVYVGASGPAPVQTICETPGYVLGASWNQQGTILFGTPGGAPGNLFHVPQSGGTPAALRLSGLFPSFLPDGRHFLYYSGVGHGVPSVRLAMPDGNERTMVEGGMQFARYAPPASRSEKGHLLFTREGALVAQPMDPVRFELTGEAVPLVEQIAVRRGSSFSSVSMNGVLAYMTGIFGSTPLVWFDREGKPQPLEGAPGFYSGLALSADGTRAALTKTDMQTSQTDIWLLDLAHGVPTRFTDDPTNDAYPVWSPDGKRLVFGSLRNGPGDLYQKQAGGAAKEQALLKTALQKGGLDWSDDGRFLLYNVLDPKSKFDLWVLPLEGAQKPAPFVAKPYNETQGQFSPGPVGTRWIAYTSDDSGQFEIYVEPFPAGTDRFRISSGGGTQPRWRRDGKELYYIAPDRKLMAVEVKTTPRFEHGVPKPLFDSHILSFGTSVGEIRWAPAVDGKRFLFITRGEELASSPITVVVNWQAAFKQ